MTDNINNELLHLLYDIKELAINQVPISLYSLINTIDMCGYHTYLDSSDSRNIRLEIIDKEINEYNSNDHVCTLNIRFVNDNQIIVYLCRWTFIPDLEYIIDDNGVLHYTNFRIN